MARIRTIKPQHVNDKELSKISLPAHLFWILSWCFSDDSGVIENDPFLLRSQIFPRRTDIRVEQVQQWIDQLIKARFVIPFTHEGEGYLIHRTFHAHQKIDRPQPSKIPSETIRRILDECSTNARPCIVKESIVKESIVKDSIGEAQAPDGIEKKLLLDNPFSDNFLQVWTIWKDYKKKEHRFFFKSVHSEQEALNVLVKLSDGIEETAIDIIQQSIANGWKGLFALKHEHGKGKNGSPGSVEKPGRSERNDRARAEY